jgi:TolB-like protein/class 3 adenylate cyclase/Tfp pilus assembly protein PilF
VEKDHLSRKLAVILHADVVGSTLLVQKNEALAHKRIQAAFHQFSETIDSYGGVTRELRGDALVAEFERASDAVAAAIAFQAQNGKLNSTLADEIHPDLRIGISLGEVIIADNTITGVGVVLAQRLEQLAEPGGVVVQGSVFETVPTRLPFEFKNLGEQTLKGIDQPVRAYTPILQPGADLPAPEELSYKPAIEPAPAGVNDPSSLDIDEKPSIAVLPFNNMSGDPEQEYFADGIAEDITTALSRFHDLLVVARNSAFTYRGTAVDVRQIGQELDVQYVLEGSVRSASNRVRITAQLIEAQSGNHVWAERFDRPLEDVFEVQDEITALVASTVGRQVTIAEYRATRDRAVQDLDYRGLLHRAMWYMDKVTAEDCVKAREYAQQALDRYPNYSGGYSLMAYVSIIELIFGWGGDRRAQLFPEATEYATKGISLDPDDELAHATMGDIYWLSGDHDAAIKEGETILQLNSNFPFGYGLIGSVHACSGSTYYQQAVENLEHAIRLSPNDPWLQFYFSFRGLAEFFNQNYDEAINWFQRSIQRNSNSAAPRCRLAAALALKGELEKAKAALGDALQIEPGLSLSVLRQRISQMYRNEQDFETYAQALRLAGLPEE